MKKLIVSSLLILICMCSNSFAVQVYHELGVSSSPSDKSSLDGHTQGVGTQIYATNSQTFSGGGYHYFWVATGIIESSSTVFAQMGYYLHCQGCAMHPFIFTSGSSVPGSDIFMFYNNYTLQNNSYYTFWFGYSGTQNGNGTYKWYFNLWGPNYTGGPTIQFINFAGQYANAPYTISEVGGSSSPCNDTLNVTYGNGTANNYALLAQKNGSWLQVSHAIANYYYANCTSNVSKPAYQRDKTVIPQTRTTCAGYSCSSGCDGDPTCYICGGCQVW